jgi:membrane-bound ClpP family serine protease
MLTPVIIFLILGIILFLVEIFLIPGISVAGIGGLLSTGVAIFLAFQISFLFGILALLFGLILLGLLVWLVYYSKTLDKISLKTNIDATVEKADEKNEIKVGDVGIALSRLAPMGKVKINDIVIEAKTEGEFLDENTKVIVLKVFSNNILVAPFLENNINQ